VPLIAQSVQSAACQTGLRVRRRGESAAAEHKGGETPGSVLGGLISGGMSTPVGSASNRHHGERILVDDPEHPASRASAQTAVIQKDEGRESVSTPFQATRLVSPPPTRLPKRPQSAPDSSRIDPPSNCVPRAASRSEKRLHPCTAGRNRWQPLATDFACFRD